LWKLASNEETKPFHQMDADDYAANLEIMSALTPSPRLVFPINSEVFRSRFRLYLSV